MRRLRTTTAWAWFLLVSTACAADTSRSLIDGTLEDGDLLIAARYSEKTGVLEVAHEVFRGGSVSLTLSPAADAESSIAIVRVAAGTLVDAAGAPLDLSGELLDVAAGREEGAGFGDCKRCMVPAFDGTQRLTAGESCPLPSSTELLEGEPEALALLRSGVELRVRGPCSCPLPEEVPWLETPPPEVLFPEGAEDWITTLAWLPSGVLAGFSERRAFAFDTKTGERISREAPFQGPLAGAYALAGGILAVAQTPQGEGIGLDLWLFDRSLEASSIDVSDAPLDSLDGVMVEGESIYLWGRAAVGIGDQNRILRCSLQGRRLACERITQDDFLFSMSRPSPLLFFPVGDLLAAVMTSQVQEILVTIDPSTKRVQALRADALPTAGTAVRTASMLPLGGGRVILCLAGTPPAGDAGGFNPILADGWIHVLVVDWSEVTPGSAELSPSVVEIDLPTAPVLGRCQGFAPAQDGSGTIALSLGEGEGLRIDLEASTIEGPQPIQPLVGFRAEELSHRPDEVTLARTNGGSWWLREDREPGGTFRHALGPPGRPTGALELVAWDDGLLALGTGWAGLVQSSTVTELPELSALLEGPTDAVAVDSAKGGLLRASSDRTAVRLEHIWVDERTVEPWDSSALHATILSIVELEPGRFVLLDLDGNLFLAERERITPLRVDWDDPRTEAGEQRAGLCARTNRVGSAEEPIRAASASGGVVWLAGCESTLVKVEAQGDGPPSVTRMALELELEGDIGQDITALRALCPDRLLIGGRAVESTAVRQTGFVWELESLAAGSQPLQAKLHRDYLLGFPSVRDRIVTPIGFARAGSRTLTVSREQVQALGSSRVQRLGTTVSSVGDGDAALVSSGGWIFRFED